MTEAGLANNVGSEEWRDIPGHSGYQASSLGRIRSKTRILSDGRQWRGRVMKTLLNSHGYEKISLALGSKALGYRYTDVHILVAETFLGPKPGPDYEVGHDDGSRTNNCVSNLKWTTAKGNAADRDRHGRTAHLKGSLHPNAKLSEEAVLEIREMKAAGCHIDVISERFGISKLTAYDAIARRTWGHI